MIPGLLQTPAYARAVIAGTIPHATAEQAATRLEVRMRRQDRLRAQRNPLRLWVVLDESALWRVVGSREAMREQLDHLTRSSENCPETPGCAPRHVRALAGPGAGAGRYPESHRGSHQGVRRRNRGRMPAHCPCRARERRAIRARPGAEPTAPVRAGPAGECVCDHW
ncbi:Scr1 family TA system antitoxin-like transcriptional regulator [Streptomyces sp. NPDC056224]|uniref:Scr1 family TA system antitoxin-like transcriptional regulator n=1 Tax=Streptomyces sp. NPDC056224 TaxID=3345750 RepID=UPI0035D8145B